MLTVSNQSVTLVKQLFKELSFQKNWPIKRAAATAEFPDLKQQFIVGHLYNVVIATKHSFANTLIAKWSCADRFYVSIGNTICQLSINYLLESDLNFFGIIVTNYETKKSQSFHSNCKKIITKQMLSLAFEQVVIYLQCSLLNSNYPSPT